MYLRYHLDPTFLLRNIINCCVLVAFVFFKILLCKVSYALCSSSIELMTWVNNIISSCYSYLGPKEKPYTRWIILMCLAFCSGWTCDSVSQLAMFNHKLLCIDSISFPYWIELIGSSLPTRSNYFPHGYLSGLILIPYSLFLLIIYNPMILTSPPLGRWWKKLPTIFSIMWLVRPRPHVKYSRTLYPNITVSFN